MTIFTRRTTLGILALPALPALPAPARAQDPAWPVRPVRVVVPYAPGGGTDTFTRLLAEAMQAALGQPFVVENRPGANGVIGSEAVARGTPDGHLLAVVVGTHIINRHVLPSLPYDPITDFTPLTLLCRTALVLVANPDAPFRDVPTLIAHARANPGMAFGSSEAGTTIAGHDFARAAGLAMEHALYRGGGPMLNDVISGTLGIGWTSTGSAAPHLRSGRLRVLGVSSARRTAMLPEVPTIAEAGVPGFEYSGWYGMFGPPAMPPGLAARIAAAAAERLAEPALRGRLEALGVDIQTLPPPAFAEFLRQQDARWAEAKARGLLPR
jgi:tripartite-type tricarboxylate transporter receptor subunit TctC